MKLLAFILILYIFFKIVIYIEDNFNKPGKKDIMQYRTWKKERNGEEDDL